MKIAVYCYSDKPLHCETSQYVSGSDTPADYNPGYYKRTYPYISKERLLRNFPHGIATNPTKFYFAYQSERAELSSLKTSDDVEVYSAKRVYRVLIDESEITDSENSEFCYCNLRDPIETRVTHATTTSKVLDFRTNVIKNHYFPCEFPEPELSARRIEVFKGKISDYYHFVYKSLRHHQDNARQFSRSLDQLQSAMDVKEFFVLLKGELVRLLGLPDLHYYGQYFTLLVDQLISFQAKLWRDALDQDQKQWLDRFFVKLRIISPLNDYIPRWLLSSLFVNTHGERAKEVRSAIMNSPDLPTIRKILKNQKDLLSDKPDSAVSLIDPQVLSPAYTTRAGLQRGFFGVGGYQFAIDRCLEESRQKKFIR